MSRTFSMPIRRSSAATNSAARRTSPECSGSVEIDGMRSKAFSSSTKRPLFWLAYSTAVDVCVVTMTPHLKSCGLKRAQTKYMQRTTPPRVAHQQAKGVPCARAEEESMSTSRDDGNMVDDFGRFDLTHEIADSEAKK